MTSPLITLLITFLVLSLIAYALGYVTKFYKFLSKTSPFFWGFLYLLLIPFFAFIYDAFFPFSFSYSVRNEEKIEWKINIEDKLKTSLQEDLVRNIMLISSDDSLRMKSKNRLSYKKGNYYIPAPLNYENNEEKYSMLMPIFIREMKIHEDTITLNLSLSMQESIYNNDFVDLQIQAVIPKTDILDLSFILTEIQSPHTYKVSDEIKSKYNNIIIPFGKKVYEKSLSNLNFSVESFKLLSVIQEVNQGKMRDVGNNFYRMFYFSAITITTTGFGDIVPITEDARLTVAFETIIGVILIGLFLNSLSFKIGEIKKDSLEKIE